MYMFKVHDLPDPGLVDQSWILSFLSWVQVIENIFLFGNTKGLKCLPPELVVAPLRKYMHL